MTASLTPGTGSESASPTVAPDDRAIQGIRPANDATSPDVEIIDVTKRFGTSTAVDHMNLHIARGEFYSLLGPSGCGKTTTLRMIAGFEQPTEGEILLAGQPIAGVPPYKRNVNTVFQHYALFPHMDVARNVGYGLRQTQGRQERGGPPRERGPRDGPPRRATSGAAPGRCPAASSSASRSRGPWSTIPRCSSSTSRWARST